MLAEFEEGGTRIDDLRLVVSRAAAAAGLFDSDGLSILTMNGQQKWDGVNSEQGAARIVDQIQYSGMTPLGSMFQRKAVEPLLLGPARQGTLRKPLLFIVVTDGEPVSCTQNSVCSICTDHVSLPCSQTSESRSKLAEVIQSAKDELSRTRYGADAFSLELACVGNDQGARRFLEEIDGHPQIGRYVDVSWPRTARHEYRG